MINAHISTKYLLLLLLSSVFAHDLLAQEPSSSLEPIIETKKALLISTPHQRYPLSAARSNKEGAVTLSFIINEEGNTQNIMIEDAVGGEAFEIASIKATEKFIFEPAIRDGKPISQSMVQYKFYYKLSDLGNGARRKFLNDYTDIMALIESNDEDTDDQINHLLTELKYANVNNLYEYAWHGMDG